MDTPGAAEEAAPDDAADGLAATLDGAPDGLAALLAGTEGDGLSAAELCAAGAVDAACGVDACEPQPASSIVVIPRDVTRRAIELNNMVNALLVLELRSPYQSCQARRLVLISQT